MNSYSSENVISDEDKNKCHAGENRSEWINYVNKHGHKHSIIF